MDKKKEINIPKPDSVEKPEPSDEVKSQLPIPKGWKILIAMPEAKETTDGGIIKASQTRVDEETSNICGYVLKLGTEAYADKKRFPTGDVFEFPLTKEVLSQASKEIVATFRKHQKLRKVRTFLKMHHFMRPKMI